MWQQQIREEVAAAEQELHRLAGWAHALQLGMRHYILSPPPATLCSKES
jgi:hypothetical protein